MKKTYKTPTMKVRKIHCSHMLCESGDGYFRINNDSAYDGQEAWSKEDDEIGW